MKRYGKVIGLKPEKEQEYRRLHAAVWPEVETMISACHLRNFTIFLRRLPDGLPYLFMFFEYHGADIEKDMARMAADPKTQEWWAICKPCQEPLEPREPDEWWADMEEVYYLA